VTTLWRKPRQRMAQRSTSPRGRERFINTWGALTLGVVIAVSGLLIAIFSSTVGQLSANEPNVAPNATITHGALPPRPTGTPPATPRPTGDPPIVVVISLVPVPGDDGGPVTSLAIPLLTVLGTLISAAGAFLAGAAAMRSSSRADRPAAGTSGKPDTELSPARSAPEQQPLVRRETPGDKTAPAPQSAIAPNLVAKDPEVGTQE
jgi:hypothetical protein